MRLSGLLACLMCTPAWAMSPEGSDVAVSSIGAQATQASAIEGGTDLDVLLGQRLRWTLAEGEASRWVALADARFTLDTGGGDTFETTLVRQLGVRLAKRRWTLDVGRHEVQWGGPRLVDGLQLIAHPSQRWDVGMWAGLAPDLFTTLPRVRPGGGPVIAYVRPRFQASTMGEVLFADGGLDRVASLTQVRGSLDRLLEVSGRLDVELVGEEGPHLSDLLGLAIYRPTEALRFDLLYNAFSTYKYQQTERLDQRVDRFATRVQNLGISLGVAQDSLDPYVNHLLGGVVLLQPESDGAAPRFKLEARQRFNPNPLNRFQRLHPQAGLVNIAMAGRLDLLADANLIAVDGDTQGDAGLLVLWEPGEQGLFAIDTSVRGVSDPDLDGLGLYADLFLDWVLPIDMMVNMGASITSEPDAVVDVPDMGMTGYLRVSKYFRPAK